MDKLVSILKQPLKSYVNGDTLVCNFLSESESSKFYNELFDSSRAKKKLPDLYHQVKAQYQADGTANKRMEEIISFLCQKLDPDAVVIELGGGIYQERSANAYTRFKHYFPLDISLSSISRYTEKFQKAGIVCDATNLPFADSTVDCIYSHTFLEHPLDPEKVLNEISRVLKPGGIVVHNDAWFCRWWQHYGFIGLKSPAGFTKKERLIYVAYKVCENKVLRISPIVIRRLFRHFLGGRQENPIRLAYKKLKPNYTLHLGCDEDAASSIDPVDVMRFYESRGFRTYHKLSLKERILYPNKQIIMVKNP
jgi:ubiquinone/menaquinone biosynthesis C-methylase UbiE